MTLERAVVVAIVGFALCGCRPAPVREADGRAPGREAPDESLEAIERAESAPPPPTRQEQPRPQETPPPEAAGEAPGGRLSTVNGYRVLELRGTPEEMGLAHGRLLREDVRKVVRDVIERSSRLDRILAGARVMERHQPERYRREMRALADAAGVEYVKIVALQLFGDVERAYRASLPGREGGDGLAESLLPERFAAARLSGHYACTNFAVFGPATRTGECIVGRNFDYWYQDVARYASIVIHYRNQAPLRSFVTLTWAGVVNGWTLMSDAGVCAANNLSAGRANSLEGVSTCFLQRLVVEEAGSVAEGVAIARRSARAVGTAMLIAGGEPPDAVEVEFDHEDFVVRRAHRGFVIADNTSRALGRERPLGPEESAYGRYGTLLGLISEGYGRIDREMNFAAAPGVPLEGINLHSALLFPADLTFAVSMGRVPACRHPFRRFRMTAAGVASAEEH